MPSITSQLFTIIFTKQPLSTVNGMYRIYKSSCNILHLCYLFQVRAATRAKKTATAQSKSPSPAEAEVCSTCQLSDQYDVEGTRWIQCTSCHRWYHEACLQITYQQFENLAKSVTWYCILCESVCLVYLLRIY